MSDEITSKTVHKIKEEEEGQGRRSKTLNEVKPVENISKNPDNFLDINPFQKKIPPSHRLEDLAHE